MKYNRLTKRIANDEEAFLFHSSLHEGIERLAELEDKIESGELCDREEVRKETAREILFLLGKGFDETTGKDFKDLQWYKQFCRELELRYGIELFGKTEQVENSDKLGGENND